MMRDTFAAAALLALLVAASGCRDPQPDPEPAPPDPEVAAPAAGDATGVRAPATAVDPSAPVAVLAGEWHGALPCAACERIDTRLWLEPGEGPLEGSYRLVEVHRGAADGDQRFEHAGLFRVVVGEAEALPGAPAGERRPPNAAAAQPPAPIIELDPTLDQASRYFVQVSPDTLQQLDAASPLGRPQAAYRLERATTL